MIAREDIIRLQAEVAQPSRFEKHKGPLIIAALFSLPFWLAYIFGR